MVHDDDEVESNLEDDLFDIDDAAEAEFEEADPDNTPITNCTFCDKPAMIRQFFDDSNMIRIRKLGVGPVIKWFIDCDSSKKRGCQRDPVGHPEMAKFSRKAAVDWWNAEQERLAKVKARLVKIRELEAKEAERAAQKASKPSGNQQGGKPVTAPNVSE